MKFLFSYFFICCAFLLSAQTTPKKATIKTDEEKWELAKIIKTRVLIKDTTSIATVSKKFDPEQTISEYNDYTYINYLEPIAYYKFVESIFTIAQSKNALVFAHGITENKLSPAHIRERYTLCDSMMEVMVDASGNEVVTKIWRCDSVSKLSEVFCVNFYESWYFDEKTKMIQKDVLAYELLNYLKHKDVYTSIFMVVKDEAARKKLTAYYFGAH